MTTYTAPSWLKPAAFEATLVPNVRAFTSAYGGANQMQDLLGERWRYVLSLPPCSRDDAAAREALFAKLRGGAHRLRLPHFGRPLPRGTLRGSPTLGSAAAQGASTLTLAGCTGTNLITRGGFDEDLGAGIGTGWSAVQTGSTGTISRDTAFDLSYGFISRHQRVFCSALASGSANFAGVSGASINVTAGQTYTISADVATGGTGDADVQVYMPMWTAGFGAYVGDLVRVTRPVRGSAPVRVSVTGQAPAGAEIAQPWVLITNGSGISAALFVDNVQIAVGSESTFTSTTVKAGDMLGLADGQLVMVADDATADDSGAMTVTLANRLRAAVSSGTAVTWNRPMADFMLMEPGGVPVRHEIGVSAPIQVELTEVW